MKTYDERLDEYVSRCMDKFSMPLAAFIESENLTEWHPGYLDILEGDTLNIIKVPCRGHMILARNRYDEEQNDNVSEYAIYTLDESMVSDFIDWDHLNRNVFNCETRYTLDYVGEETFDNLASAISYAAGLIYRINTERSE